MNLILEKSDRVPYYTNMSTLLLALGVSGADYDWFVSDLEFFGLHDVFSPSDRWVTGEELSAFIDSNDIQFCWGVFSAVAKGVRFEVVSPPYADGNRELWTSDNLEPQLPGALFEIVCWDSSTTLLIGLPPLLVNSFLLSYPEATALTPPPI